MHTHYCWAFTRFNSTTSIREVATESNRDFLPLPKPRLCVTQSMQKIYLDLLFVQDIHKCCCWRSNEVAKPQFSQLKLVAFVKGSIWFERNYFWICHRFLWHWITLACIDVDHSVRLMEAIKVSLWIPWTQDDEYCATKIVLLYNPYFKI